ncbi:MAG TPA: chemotaxis protein CheA [Caldithrix abyssi]|uniref:Chemotaxis protein CheA n=1 Tax=Caldithrix abyssi TaxID=187145 RepID=A0A7V1PU25_CALAY|nr:chemotaxis protein CheA [Caldithrix abyssi]
MSNILNDDKEILIDFINESNEALEKTELVLLGLEENLSAGGEVDENDINTIFRTFHSIKGSAGFIGLVGMNHLTHEAETLLDNIRKGKTNLQKTHIDIFLEVSDTLMMMMNHLHENFSEEGFPGDIDELKQRIIKLIEETAPVAPQDKSRGGAGKKTKSSAKSSGKTKEEEKPAVTDSMVDALISPELVKQFVVDASELLDGMEQDLLALEKAPDTMELIESVFRNMHSLKGNAGFFNYSDISQVCHQAETFLDMVRSGNVQAESNQISLILQVLDFLRIAIENLDNGKPPVISGKIGLLDLMTDVFALDTTEEPETNETPSKEEVKRAAEENNEQKPEAKAVKDANQVKSKPVAKPSVKPHSSMSDVIRVDVEKLNKLMNLVGEIVISESMVSHNPDLRGLELESVEKSISYLQKNVRELQELATAMRMIPLNGLFSKMKRLIRDLATKNGKKIDLIINGGETEVDRSVLEHISDPLVHILRNSADHGIEVPEARKKRGKTETGRIELSAKQVGGEIWIVVEDDGNGLNREKILNKALEKGLITENDMDMPDEKVWNLIFQPGFSTADQVSDISGRGVGMDVVVRNVEKIRGRVEVDSMDGQGTRVNLRIPLTTAIVDGMLMRVEETIYAIPTLDIKESLQVGDQHVVDLMDGQEVIKIREQLIPILRLHELHELSFKAKPLSEGIVVVTEKGPQGIGFLVDEILGQQQLVIKPLPGYLGNIRGVSGCAVLGNGEICLILDLSNLIKMVEVK